MNTHSNIAEISAELLLNLLYPEQKKQWIVKNKGTFYRNYSTDVLAIDEKTKEVKLSRDGFLKYLPQGLLTTDEELKKGGLSNPHEALRKRLNTLKEAFVPIDTNIFRRRLDIEGEITELLNNQIDYLLKTYLGYDRSKETNPYIKVLSVILPYISKLRSNIRFVKNLLTTIVGCDVEMSTGRYSETDNSRYWLAWIKYDLLIPNLSQEKYQELSLQMKELEAFISQWFMPFDTKCSIRIKHHQQPFQTDGNLILDYNTEL